MIMIVQFYILCQLILIITIKSQTNNNNEREQLQQPKLEDKCLNDIEQYCPNEKQTWAILCLETYRDKLSNDCKEYLGTTVIGGCNNEAANLCNDKTTTNDILLCLDENESQLSEACLTNLHNQLTGNNRWKLMEKRYKHITFVVSILSIIYLSIPLIFFLWATYRMKQFHKIQHQVLINSGLSKPVIAINDEEQAMISNLKLEIGFIDLSYWVNEQASFNLYNKPDNKKQILKNVSGQFPTKSLTAIMGPSGSGKTTLLKLLAGQITTGEYKGSRILNGQDLNPKDYLRIMNTQGYVAQQDYFLETLTVWQTLCYAALLRIRDDVSITEKITRAAKVMYEMGLESAANTVLSNESHNSDNSKGISGGQRRRLSIAQALLGNPQAILLDEPTSGLDASTSMQLVKCLNKMTKELHTTIAITIHQPRSEVFALFDNLILLGSGGYLVYSGSNQQAAQYLDSMPIVNLSLSSYDNPGDFIMDVLDKSNYSKSSGKNNKIIDSKTSTNINININNTFDVVSYIRRFFHIDSNSQLNQNLGNYELVSINDSTSIDQSVNNVLYDDNNNHLDIPSSYDNINYEIESLHYLTDQTNESFNNLYNENTELDKQQNTKTNHFIIELSNLFLSSIHYKQLIDKYQIINPINKSEDKSTINNTPVAIPSVLGYSDVKAIRIIDISLQNILAKTEKPPNSLLDQLWILYSRRIQTLLPTIKEFTMFTAQLFFVGVIVTYTFSYTVSTQLELPYQVLMILVVISTYIMIIQYLGLVNEYMTERKVIISENTGGYISFWTYSFSAVLTEIPRAIAQCFLFYFLIHQIRPVNPDRIFKLFFLVCLMIGTIAWQSQIAVCSAITDQISIAYTITFLVLGSGTLFGGLALRLSKIPRLFKLFYYFSVAAVTQRAIVTNDMQCCYLSATCNSISKELQQPQQVQTNTPSNHRYLSTYTNDITSFKDYINDNIDIKRILTNSTYDPTSSAVLSYFESNNYCPPGIQFTGDGSDEGNLGRMYLKFMGLEHDFPFFSLVYLFITNILFRIMSIVILYVRKYMKYDLKFIPESAQS